MRTSARLNLHPCSFLAALHPTRLPPPPPASVHREIYFLAGKGTELGRIQQGRAGKPPNYRRSRSLDAGSSCMPGQAFTLTQCKCSGYNGCTTQGFSRLAPTQTGCVLTRRPTSRLGSAWGDARSQHGHPPRCGGTGVSSEPRYELVPDYLPITSRPPSSQPPPLPNSAECIIFRYKQ